MAMIDRTGAAVLFTVEEENEIAKELPQQSAALSLFSRVSMSKKQKRVKVESVLPQAYFVDGEPTAADEDNGWKQTSKMEWSGKTLEAEEIAVIVPLHENALDDADYDIWGETKPKIVEAFGRVIDGATFFGTNKPSTWPAGLIPAAITAGNTFERGSVANQPVDEDISAVMAMVENDGYMTNGFYSSLGMKHTFRTLKDADGRPIYLSDIRSDGRTDSLYGEPLRFCTNGIWNGAVAEMVTGDFRKAIIAVRKDITTKILTEGVIQDPTTKEIVYNLAQQDMVALRVTMRVAFNYVNPVTLLNATSGTRFPFAVLAPVGE